MPPRCFLLQHARVLHVPVQTWLPRRRLPLRAWRWGVGVFGIDRSLLSISMSTESVALGEKTRWVVGGSWRAEVGDQSTAVYCTIPGVPHLDQKNKNCSVLLRVLQRSRSNKYVCVWGEREKCIYLHIKIFIRRHWPTHSYRGLLVSRTVVSWLETQK